MNCELPDVQAGFRKGRGTRDQTANIPWIIEKAREFQKNSSFCFIDYAKAFDCVDDNKLWKILKEMGIPDHLTWLLRNLYAGQEATVRSGHGTTGWFQIGTSGRKVRTKEPLDESGEQKSGLKLNIQKTKIIVSSPITSWQIDRETTVTDFIVLGSKITVDGDYSHEIKKTLAPWKKSYDQPIQHIQRRKWQPTPVFLTGESQGWGSLVGCRLWGCTESDTTEVT